ncbi:hypothetical protein Anapl_01858 [Anas platyrhynchos]|uniref:Uncharacterized protein n=1 Tax=Anas platyrhynchos TaxID=8839 RepID=R0KE31_ANAPL|nr:hypothetical protein Anapl_01858 [Anas platyrhynchos]
MAVSQDKMPLFPLYGYEAEVCNNVKTYVNDHTSRLAVVNYLYQNCASLPEPLATQGEKRLKLLKSPQLGKAQCPKSADLACVSPNKGSDTGSGSHCSMNYYVVSVCASTHCTRQRQGSCFVGDAGDASDHEQTTSASPAAETQPARAASAALAPIVHTLCAQSRAAQGHEALKTGLCMKGPVSKRKQGGEDPVSGRSRLSAGVTRCFSKPAGSTSFHGTLAEEALKVSLLVVLVDQRRGAQHGYTSEDLAAEQPEEKEKKQQCKCRRLMKDPQNNVCYGVNITNPERTSPVHISAGRNQHIEREVIHIGLEKPQKERAGPQSETAGPSVLSLLLERRETCFKPSCSLTCGKDVLKSSTPLMSTHISPAHPLSPQQLCEVKYLQKEKLGEGHHKTPGEAVSSMLTEDTKVQ